MRRAVYATIVAIILAFVIGFPAYIAFGQVGGGKQAAVIITAKPRYVVSPPGGGGGGAPAEEGCPAGETNATKYNNTEGLFIRTLIVESFDGRLRLIIDEGTLALTRHGARLACVGVHENEDVPPLPEDAYLVSPVYDAVPDGASFSPPAILRYSYEPGALPVEVAEERLAIASYDRVSSKWTSLYSAVDTKTHTVTAEISHFTDLAVFGYGAEAPPPAAFQVSSLKISPTMANIGEMVTISVLVTNTGGQAASYQVVLRINGVVEGSREVVLDPGASTEVSFTVLKGEPGLYSVDVNGATSKFEVQPVLPPPPKPFNWWIIAIAAGGAALAALLTHALLSQKRYGGITGVLSADLGRIRGITSFVSRLRVIRSLFSKGKRTKKSK